MNPVFVRSSRLLIHHPGVLWDMFYAGRLCVLSVTVIMQNHIDSWKSTHVEPSIEIVGSGTGRQAFRLHPNRRRVQVYSKALCGRLGRYLHSRGQIRATPRDKAFQVCVRIVEFESLNGQDAHTVPYRWRMRPDLRVA
jgi:hypothetical protein